MNNGNGVSRGDRSRNARLEAAGGGAGDERDRGDRFGRPQADGGRGRSRFQGPGPAHVSVQGLGSRCCPGLGCRAQHRAGAGAVACEPTGHRWRVLGQLAAERGMSFVCVQPMLTSWARKSEDLTTDKTDDKDAVLIARLTAQLRCYLPEPVDETWGRLRHLGVRREQLLDDHVACVQQIRDLLGACSAAVTTAQQPFKSNTWVAAMHVIMTRDGGDFTRTRRLGPARFEHAVRRELTRRGGIRPCLRILRKLYAALADPSGVIAHRPGAFERMSWLIEDWDTARAKLADAEARMASVLDDLELTELACSIPGLSPVGAAAILAETGDLRRSPAPAPWSSTPAWHLGNGSRAPSPDAPA